VYAEVEPDIEYFIKINSNCEDLVEVFLSVDGSELGYSAIIVKLDYDDEYTLNDIGR
jgi:hypothetical protein